MPAGRRNRPESDMSDMKCINKRSHDRFGFKLTARTHRRFDYTAGKSRKVVDFGERNHLNPNCLPISVRGFCPIVVPFGLSKGQVLHAERGTFTDRKGNFCLVKGQVLPKAAAGASGKGGAMPMPTSGTRAAKVLIANPEMRGNGMKKQNRGFPASIFRQSKRAKSRQESDVLWAFTWTNGL